MQKRLNPEQGLFTVLFVIVVLALFQFLIPDFPYKDIVFIFLCGLATYVGVVLSTTIIKAN